VSTNDARTGKGAEGTFSRTNDVQGKRRTSTKIAHVLGPAASCMLVALLPEGNEVIDRSSQALPKPRLIGISPAVLSTSASIGHHDWQCRPHFRRRPKPSDNIILRTSFLPHIIILSRRYNWGIDTIIKPRLSLARWSAVCAKDRQYRSSCLACSGSES
jgi:hypothetical protein